LIYYSFRWDEIRGAGRPFAASMRAPPHTSRLGRLLASIGLVTVLAGSSGCGGPVGLLDSLVAMLGTDDY